MNILLVAITGRNCDKLIAKLQQLLPQMQVQLWTQCTDFDAVEFVLAWNAPTDLWPKLKNLKAVSSFGAGVDSIDFSLLAEHVEVVRIVDNTLAEDMAEYVLTHVLAHKLRLREYFNKQGSGLWQPKRAHRYNHVGILGFGELGQAAAARLIANGFQVSAWARSDKQDANVTTYQGQQGLQTLLSKVDYLVCLLPLTEQTKGIINQQLLTQLAAHAVLINVARGEHVVEQDLLMALDKETIHSATLDVFSQEPLKDEHPFWQHPKITLTPHCAAISNIETVTAQIADNAKRLLSGDKLINKVDRIKGY